MVDGILLTLLTIFAIIVISAFPLDLAVSLLGGRSSILKAFLVMIVVGFLTVVVKFLFPVGGVLIAWLLVIWIFHEVFRLKWFKAVIAWALWIIFVFVLIFLLSLLGLSYLVFSF